MKGLLASVAQRYPVLENWLQRLPFAASADGYWEGRYARGGDSGSGSYGHRAAYKAEFLNRLVSDLQIESVIEFGCGDGEQLKLASYGRYIGLDIAPSGVARCSDLFADDETKSFFVYHPGGFADRQQVLQCDLALSLDVIYHVVDDTAYQVYLGHLFGCARRVVVIYSSNFHKRASAHVHHREFTPEVERRFPDWELTRHEANPYPKAEHGRDGSDADFFVYERRKDAAHS